MTSQSVSSSKRDPLAFVERSNKAKDLKTPAAVYLVATYDIHGEMNLGKIDAHLLRLKQITQHLYLVIHSFTEKDFKTAIQNVSKTLNGRPIKLLVVQAHGRNERMKLSPTYTYSKENVQESDFEELDSGCHVVLLSCETLDDKEEGKQNENTIAQEIAIKSQRATFASQAFVPVNQSFFVYNPKYEMLDWVSTNKYFTAVTSKKLTAKENKLKVQSPPSDAAIQHISTVLKTRADNGCVNSQMVYGHYLAARLQFKEAIIYYKKAEKTNSAATGHIKRAEKILKDPEKMKELEREERVDRLQDEAARNGDVFVPLNFFGNE